MSIKDINSKVDIKSFEGIIGYTYNNKTFALRALSHSSYANETKHNSILSNERLEFLGDSVLNFVVSNYIFNKYPKMPEGKMTKIRALVVCENSLANCSNKLELNKYIMLGKGEENTGGRERASILADLFEAIVASIFIDGGLENAKKFVLDNLVSTINGAVKGKLFKDYKSQLQELIQKNQSAKIEYKLLEEIGPDHDKTFISQVLLNNIVFGQGKGKTKKESEQMAASNAILNYNEEKNI